MEVYTRTEESPSSDKIFTKRTLFAGHVQRLLRITWGSTLKNDLTEMGGHANVGGCHCSGQKLVELSCCPLSPRWEELTSEV